MMMKTNVQLLCEDLDQLLKDICDYLTNEADDENMSESQRLFANKLIRRSKQQLQQISKVSMALSADVDDQSYVDMNKQSAAEVDEATYDEEIDNEYSPVCPSLPSTEELCPYAVLPAIELEKCEKFGHLDRKGRFLFIGHQKRLFAGIKGNWFLLYANKKDNKPLEMLNLNSFLARPVDSIKTKIFELKCITTQKAFQFVAQTPKDMMQWVAYMNRRSVIKEENHETNPTEEDEYDEDGVYELPTDPIKKKSKPLPPLPKPAENAYILRNPKPDAPPLDKEGYDPVSPPGNNQDDFIHDDDEDQIYDTIQDVKSDKSSKASDLEVTKPINKVILRPQLDDRSRTDSSLTNSFTDDDEEAIYDVLEQRADNKFTARLQITEAESELEEEYCNLVQNPKSRSPVVQNVDDTEEEYLNIVPNINRTQMPNRKKDSAPTIPVASVIPREVEEAEGEYSNLVAVVRTTDKPQLLPKLPLRSIVNSQKNPSDSNVDAKQVDEEYDCVVSSQKNSPRSNVHLNIKEANKQTNIKINKRNEQNLQDNGDVDEEYDCVLLPPRNAPKPNVQARIQEQKPQDSSTDPGNVEEEYDCVVPPSKTPPKTNVQAKVMEVNKSIKLHQTDTMKKNAPALKPKPKLWKNK